MLRLVTGPFHPTLESSLVQDLHALKKQDPFAGVALIVPSDQLRRYLKQLLALTHGLSLLNVHIFSFHQLALHLDRERLACSEGPDRDRCVALVTDVFFEQLLQQLSQRNVPRTDVLRLSQLSPGAWAALWASLRDLKDATVDAAVALRAVDEEQFATEDREKLKGLFTLYAALRESQAALSIGSHDDLAALVTRFVPASPFLRGLSSLCYYGSYDLTQTQLTLLEALAATVAVTVYFPLNTQPAYGFARQFLERHLYPFVGTPDANASPSREDPIHPHDHKPKVSVEVRNAAGIDDELTLVCKQILSLVETNGYGFGEIGVVGRTLVPYQSSLKRTFDQHRIPFVSSATLSLLQKPAVKTLLHLAQLKGNGLYCSAVMEVITSPWNRRLMSHEGSVEPRLDLWRLAVQALGITRGEEEWRRLAKLSRLDTSPTESEDTFTETLGAVRIDGAQLRLLWSSVSELIDDVTGLPDRGGYGQLTDAFLSLADNYLTLSLGPSASIDPASKWDRAGDVTEALANVFTQLRELDRLAIEVTWDDWTETFVRILERTTCAVTSGSHDGVQVLDAMAARGVGFRTLFIVGMNEKLFPRFIHEDGFLRDRHRLVLNETLGYKIDQKLQGYAEEALLFELLRSAASERLYLSYQRADAAGRPLVPSTYLDRIEGLPQPAGGQSVFALPRRWPDRAELALFMLPLLTREELTVSTVLQGRDVSALLEAVGRDGHVFSHGLEAQRAIESDQPNLNSFDGMLESSTSRWSHASRRGFSPTALESYARCPFQYFAGHMLELESVRRIPSRELSPAEMGQLCHDTLRLCYPLLIEQGWPGAALSAEIVTREIRQAVIRASAAYAETHGTGYALTWQLAQELVERLVTFAVASDREEALLSGFLPTECEIDATGTLPYRADLDSVALRGRWDRVDRHPVSGGLRVIDYKYRANGQIEGKDRNLLQAALRATKLQPALYALMTATSPSGVSNGPLPEQVDFLYLLPQGASGVERASFPGTAWQGPFGHILSKTLQVLVDGLREGQHFIVPDSYCEHCDFSTACRLAHQPTWWRAYRSSHAGVLRSLRYMKVPRD
jgi:ATP-dependent helicase/nuclease subunit B